MLTTVITPHTPVAHGGNPQTLADSLAAGAIAQRLVEKTALAPLNPLPALREGRQSVALAEWGSSGLISNQADMISVFILMMISLVSGFLYFSNQPLAPVT
ncbi:hypothetical protein CK516_24710 [Nostoc sp. 'Peltigera malacea cyanobiont' DB3992]|nr:hypothetical protein CK516_24710 [Nostoc sp. 'Peltigera malacea cyanobiont' DB3992]